jgi:hypothetical protein
MSGSITYLFYAVDKPLSPSDRAQIQKLSRRVAPTARKADFWYNVDGYDLPVAYESLLAQYYDVMVRQDYEQWTLAFAVPYSLALYQELKRFECEDGEGCGVRVEAIDARYSPESKRKVTNPTRILAEINTFLDYDAVALLTGLREWKWMDNAEDDGEVEEDWDAEEWNDEYTSGGGLDETLARLANTLREAALHNDLRAFYIAWQKFNDSDAEIEIPVPPKSQATYLKTFKKMLLSNSER